MLLIDVTLGAGSVSVPVAVTKVQFPSVPTGVVSENETGPYKEPPIETVANLNVGEAEAYLLAIK